MVLMMGMDYIHYNKTFNFKLYKINMNQVILQLWEESNLNDMNLSDGCTLHINSIERDNYIKSIYDGRYSNIPNKYDRIVGKSINVMVTDEIYENINKNKNIKLSEVSFQNLKKFSDIIFEKENI